MKEKFKIFRIEIEPLTGRLTMIDTDKTFISYDDAKVHLRSNIDLQNGEYIVLNVYKKENGKMKEYGLTVQ